MTPGTFFSDNNTKLLVTTKVSASYQTTSIDLINGAIISGAGSGITVTAGVLTTPGTEILRFQAESGAGSILPIHKPADPVKETPEIKKVHVIGTDDVVIFITGTVDLTRHEVMVKLDQNTGEVVITSH